MNRKTMNYTSLLVFYAKHFFLKKCILSMKIHLFTFSKKKILILPFLYRTFLFINFHSIESIVTQWSLYSQTDGLISSLIDNNKKLLDWIIKSLEKKSLFLEHCSNHSKKTKLSFTKKRYNFIIEKVLILAYKFSIRSID